MLDPVLPVAAEIRRLCPEAIDPQWRMAAFIDVETTGLYCDRDEIIELSAVLFCFDPYTGEIKGIVDQYIGLREPGCNIHPGAFKVHGISMEMLKGKRLDDHAVLNICRRADFLLAHNASFDRGFVCAMYPELSQKRWFCTMNGIAWKKKGFESRALSDLLEKHKVQMDKHHRAGFDCTGAVMLLSLPNGEGKTYLKELLEYYEVKGQWKTPSLPLTPDEELIFETIRELVGNQDGIGYYKKRKHVSVGFDDGGYWFARYRWGPRSKYIIIKPSNDAQDEQKISLTSAQDLVRHAELIRVACARALEWYETSKKYKQEKWEQRREPLSTEIRPKETQAVEKRTSSEKKKTFIGQPNTGCGCALLAALLVLLVLALNSCLK